MSDPQPASVGGTPTVDGFTDLRLLGHGGFSSVFEATDEVLHRRVALKVIKTDTIDDRRFHKECRILASLSGVKGIVSVLQATATADGRPVIVMHMYRGGTLADRVLTNGPLDAKEGVKLGAVLAAALGTAHRDRIFHRDIKPSNVLFDVTGEPAISDFGIAVTAASSSTSETLGSLSPPHAPPERFGEDFHTDPVAGDVYSLGSTLYYAIAGRCPFGTAADEGGLAALMERVATVELPPIERDDISTDLNAVLRTAMAKEPWHRFDSMEGFLAALRSCHPTALSSWIAPPSEVIHAGSVPLVPRTADRSRDHATVVDEPGDVATGDCVATGLDPRPADPPSVSGGGGHVPARVALVSGSRLMRVGSRMLVVLAVLSVLGFGGWSVQRFLTTSDPGTHGAPQKEIAAPEDGSGATSSSELAATTQPTESTATTEPFEVLAPRGFVTSTENAAALKVCMFSGSGLLARPLAGDTSGDNHLVLAPGTSVLTCSDRNGFARQGAFGLTADFEELTQTYGTGSGSGTITWADATTTTFSAEVTLDLPEIQFAMSLENGPFAGQEGAATLMGWRPVMREGTEEIAALVFEPTRVQMSGS